MFLLLCSVIPYLGDIFSTFVYFYCNCNAQFTGEENVELINFSVGYYHQGNWFSRNFILHKLNFFILISSEMRTVQISVDLISLLIVCRRFKSQLYRHSFQASPPTPPTFWQFFFLNIAPIRASSRSLLCVIIALSHLPFAIFSPFCGKSYAFPYFLE